MKTVTDLIKDMAKKKNPKVACFATIPKRHSMAKRALEALLPQVDAVLIVFNYKDEPLPSWANNRKGLYVEVADNTKGDAEKFTAVDAGIQGFHFICDDDVKYRRDYTSFMIKKLKQYKYKAVIGFIGAVMKNDMQSYYHDRERFGALGKDKLRKDIQVHLCCTNSMAFHSRAVEGLKKKVFKKANMADIYMGIYCNENNIPVYVIKHPRGMAKNMAKKDKTSIYATRKSHTDVQAQEANKTNWKNFTSLYWERRYKKGGTSGKGSYGKLAEHKAKLINKFIKDNSIDSVIEFGCGDGNQLQYMDYNFYIGVDISRTAIKMCLDKYGDKIYWLFLEADEYRSEDATMGLSLDVIYHLIDDADYKAYMERLFNASRNYVAIYSPDVEGKRKNHVRYRNFSKDIPDGWKEIKRVPAKAPSKSIMAFYERAE